MTCSECSRPLGHDADPRRRTCSAACRKRRQRRRETEDRVRLLDLVARHFAAVQSGDTAAAYEIAREVERLLAKP